MLEEIDIEGRGFLPLKDYGSWRIAQPSFEAVRFVAGRIYVVRQRKNSK